MLYSMTLNVMYSLHFPFVLTFDYNAISVSLSQIDSVSYGFIGAVETPRDLDKC